MHRTVRPGVVLLSAALAVAAALSPVPIAAAAPVTPAVPAASTRVAPASGPSERVCPPATADTVTCFAERRTDIAPKAAAAAPRGYGPADLRSAYGIPAVGGSGVTVAAVVAYDYPTAERDLAVYRAQYGLPPLAAGQFRKVDQFGGGTFPRYDSGWAGEAALDVQMITAACPACRILLVEAKDDYLTNITTAAATAARLGATFVSNSYGSSDTGTTRYAASYAASGVSWFAATGDEGNDGRYVGAAPSFPATLPGVLAVGGTSLLPAAGTPRGWSERVWTGAGHGTGCSTTYGRPAFQAGVSTGCAGRAVADVAAVSDPNTGVAVYNSSDRGWLVYGGTSAATPIVAGIAALAGDPGVTGADVYLNAGSFHDVTDGRTGTCTGGVLCTAGAGWDGPTGLGTPAGVGGFSAPSAGCGGTPAVPAASSVTSAGRYVPVTPVRVLDSRLDGSRLGPGGTRTLDLGARLPSGTAAAVVLNVTVTNPTAAGYLTAWPAGTPRPDASTLNTVPGLTRANEATVALGATPQSGGTPRGVALYNFAGTTDVIVDLLGFYTAAGDTAAALTYHPAGTPSRVVDTRSSRGPLAATGSRSAVCATVSQYAGDASPVTRIAAVAVTLTAVDPTAPGYLLAWNGDVAAEPAVSTLNFVAGQTVPNATVVPVSCLDSSCSQVTFAVANRFSPSTQVVVDVVGVYAADPAAGLVLRAQTPQRIVDTRVNRGFGPLTAGATATVTVPGAVASGAVAANVTAVAPTAPTYLTVFGDSRPPTSNLNPVPGETVPAEVVTSVDARGAVSVYDDAGRVDVLVDVSGVFVPPAA